MWEFNWGVFWAVLAVAAVIAGLWLLLAAITAVRNVVTGEFEPTPWLLLQPILKKLDMIADRLEAVESVAQRQEDTYRKAIREINDSV